MTFFSVIVAYAAYSAFTQSGLAGYIMQLELYATGWADTKLTMLLTIVAIIAPIGIILVILEKLFPPRAARPMEAGSSNRNIYQWINSPVRHVPWKVVLWVTISPLAVLAILYPVLKLIDQRDQQEKVYAVDLTSGASLPKDARFVRLIGVMARHYAVTYQSGTNGSAERVKLFAPITGSGWTPSDPVRYVVRYEAPTDGEAVAWPYAFVQRGAAEFPGKLGPSIPVFVESRFRSKGMKLDRSYKVIDYRDLPGDKVPASDDALTAAIICPVLSVLLFIFLMVAKITLPLAARRQSAKLAGR